MMEVPYFLKKWKEFFIFLSESSTLDLEISIITSLASWKAPFSCYLLEIRLDLLHMMSGFPRRISSVHHSGH
jgi:hypothetical protein